MAAYNKKDYSHCKKDLKFNKLTMVSDIIYREIDGYQIPGGIFNCDCGSNYEQWIAFSQLFGRNQKSCGCVKDTENHRRRCGKAENGYKKCGVCEQVKTIDNFNINRTAKDGYCGLCKRCIKFRMIYNEYNITEEQYLDMLNKQNGKCAICGEESDKMSVDHCHKTGKVRGMLCMPCNVGIGNLKESPEILANAISYIIKANKNE